MATHYLYDAYDIYWFLVAQSGGSAVIYFGPWGGPGGNRWSYIATNGITEITIYSGDIINSISFKDANGFISGKFGGENHNDLGKGHQVTKKVLCVSKKKWNRI